MQFLTDPEDITEYRIIFSNEITELKKLLKCIPVDDATLADDTIRNLRARIDDLQKLSTDTSLNLPAFDVRRSKEV